MFSITAINDTATRDQWEPLAPTKEAQEFHLSQIYHDGLLKLQGKEYEKAQKLLESVLKDPLIANAKADSSTSDCHLQQLRFLALKNLATVFLEQGSDHYESALRCYLQAVEMDAKDSVLWNHLGSLSCSMGLLSISRWAFEQGLLCSPNNWSCMEKLLEVLIAIGDEVASLSVIELILRHWPSHSRALHVKHTIEETDSVPFVPKGIDKLEPKHVRLKFLGKRKACEEKLEEGITSKKLIESIELELPEASWAALTDALLEILCPLHENACRSRDIPITINFPSRLENFMQASEKKEPPLTTDPKPTPIRDWNSEKENFVFSKEKEAVSSEEQTQERRSTRLERLRSRKPGKEVVDFDNSKDPIRDTLQYLETFILDKQGLKDSATSSGSSCQYQTNLHSEQNDVASFVKETSKNYGAYHMGHLLLEHAASKCKTLVSQDVFFKFLELEKLTRHWGQDRKPGCSLFLAELYYDLWSSPSNFPDQSSFMSEASYHLCKIVESVALDYPLHFTHTESCFSPKSFQGDNTINKNLVLDNSLFSKGFRSFWVRYHWLSGQLSISEGNKAKGLEDFFTSLSLLDKKDEMGDSHSSIQLPHCRRIKELNIDRILHTINLLKIDILLEKNVTDMMEKETYSGCINLLAPLLFSTKDVLPSADRKEDWISSVELSALDVLIKACENIKPIDIEVYLNCRRRKLQILMVLSSMNETLASCKDLYQKSREGSSGNWIDLVAEEVKAILQCVSQVKNFINQSEKANGISIPRDSIADIQSLLLAVMLNVARHFLSKKSSESLNADQNEQLQKSCFLYAAIAFCKFQHLDSTVTAKSQVELMVGFHDLLAEYGLCCACEDGEAEEGTFLRFAIKHLLALDMKFKSNLISPNGEVTLHDQLSENELKSQVTDMDKEKNGKHEAISPKKDDSKEKGDEAEEEKVEQDNDQIAERGNELVEEEKEELELLIDNALDQCFFCLYGLNLRGDSSYEDDLAVHKNTSRGDYQTKEQCADVFQYLLPYAKASSRTGLVKLRRVLRAIRKHFPQPPDDVLVGNVIDKFLDDPNLCEEKLSDEAGSDGFLETMTKLIFAGTGSLKQYKASLFRSSEPYMDVYRNLYYFLAQSEEISASDKWPGFVLTKEGEEFVQQIANLFKYDLLYNPLRFESWQKLANIYDEEVDLLLNDGSKHINVTGWRKNAALPQRVETSRRRSRRCLLMSLALAKTPDQQCEIHELLALVYYDSLQNVVPFYDQRSIVPSKDTAWVMFCENSLKHFKKGFQHRQDWSHAFYMGKLSEKLGYSYEISLSYYDKAIALNPSAVDPVYRMHASRLKLLNKCGKHNLESLKVLASYCFDKSIKDTALAIIGTMASETSNLPERDGNFEVNVAKTCEGSIQMEGVWHMLYNDSLSALEICVEGDLKHFHKARYTLAQGLYKRGGSSDLQKAKDELSFCFKSSRSSFTINMWEIDGMVKKGRRKTPGFAGTKKALEVNLPESSRKFITCIRKYLLFYLKVLEETGDINTLERAYISLRSDKRFSLCIEDLVPVAIGRYIKALISSMGQGVSAGSSTKISSDNQLEKIFWLFMEQGNLWPEICNLPEIRSQETSESSLYGYLHQYVISLELNCKLETLETINERIRKRFKNPKLSNTNSAKVGRHASLAWCRSLIIGLASITPSQSIAPKGTQTVNLGYGVLENRRVLCIDIHTKEFWNSSFEDSTHLQSLETQWAPFLAKIKNVIIFEKVSDENVETANSLLRSCYNFYRETSCVTLPSGVNLYLMPPHLVSEGQFHPEIEGAEAVEVSIPKKLLLWAYTLLHGHCASISQVLKYMEENARPKMKRGASASSSIPTSNTGGAKDGAAHGGVSEPEAASKSVQAAGSDLSANVDSTRGTNPTASLMECQKGLFVAPQLQHCNNVVVERRSVGDGDES